MAMLPSADNATDMPWQALPIASLPTSFLPCCVQTPPPLRVNTHAAPVLPLSDHPPTMAVLPSAESATDMPWRAFPTAPVPTSFLPCCVQVPPLRVNTHAPSAPQPPTTAVLPSAESATDIPWPGGNGGSLAPLPTSLLPCCVQILPLRVKTHAAPVVLLSLGPPMMAVLPSEERATDAPWDHNPPPVFAGGANQLAALLRPGTAAAREHPCCPSRADDRRPIAISVVRARPAHDSRIAVRGQRDGHALVAASHCAGTD